MPTLFTRFTLPRAALDSPPVRLFLQQHPHSLGEDAGVIRVAGVFEVGDRMEFEDLLIDARIPFDRFRAPYPDDVDETWDRMIFRPGLGYQNICVTRSDHPLLDLRDWDTIADTPGGPITLAQVRHFLSLDVPSVADAASLPF